MGTARCREAPVPPESGSTASNSARSSACSSWSSRSVCCASDDVLVTLSALDSVVFFVLMPWATAMYMIFAPVLMLQTRAMPSWSAGLGCFAGVVSVIGGTWVFSGDPAGGVAGLGLIGGLAVLLRTVIASVFLIRGVTD